MLECPSTTANSTKINSWRGVTLPCGSNRGCKTCANINQSAQITSKTTNLQYSPRVPSCNCGTSNVVYLIQFRCGEQYVGETMNALRKRMNGHRRDIETRDLTKPVSRHFVQHQHSWEDVGVSVIEQCNSDIGRKRAEKKWMSQLMSDHPLGLNLEHVLKNDKHVFENAA